MAIKGAQLYAKDFLPVSYTIQNDIKLFPY
jgi:hypothetical protein